MGKNECVHGIHVAEGCPICSGDWRKRTCGECGFLLNGIWCRRMCWGTDGNNLMIGDVCRLTPACPAFESKEGNDATE